MTGCRMFGMLRPYPAYKPSGVPWLGNVPEHWEVRALRNVLTGTAERNRPYLPLLSVVRERGVILRDITNMEENHNFVPDDLSNYKVVHSGQFAINKMKAWQGSYGISQHDGIVSPAYFVFDLNGVSGDYFHAAIRSRAYVHFFAQASDGVRIGQWDLSQARMREIPFALPPLPEQRAIVRYLDYVDRRIRRYVAARRKLIALLEEEKQAVVNRAVTRGLDPNVRFKPSGVEWLGDVPEHWEVGPIKRAFLSMDYGISESASESGTVRLLTMGHLKEGQVLVPNDGGVDFVAPYLLLEKGDLLFNRTNSPELVGKIGLFVSHDSPVTFASYLVRMRPHPSHEPEYLNMALNDASFISRARREAIPSLHQSNLNPTRFGRIHIALPSKEEQGAILRALQGETASLVSAIARARRQIELVQEYRTRLIADVVTGKLDVREAASQLPDEGDDEEPLDEGGALADDADGDLYDADASGEEPAVESEVIA